MYNHLKLKIFGLKLNRKSKFHPTEVVSRGGVVQLQAVQNVILMR